jgi:hypothetical protein
VESVGGRSTATGFRSDGCGRFDRLAVVIASVLRLSYQGRDGFDGDWLR